MKGIGGGTPDFLWVVCFFCFFLRTLGVSFGEKNWPFKNM